MDKEKLIAAMREAVDSTRQNGFIAIRTVIEACAEAALKELGNEWVRVINQVETSIRANDSSYTGSAIILTEHDLKQVLSDISNILPSPPKDK